MLFALLLVNVFVAKELHYVIEFSHGHSHHLVDRHDGCENDIHFHTFDFEASCTICDFNFSPREQTFTKAPNLTPPLFFTSFLTYHEVFTLKAERSLPDLRGPPLHFI